MKLFLLLLANFVPFILTLVLFSQTVSHIPAISGLVSREEAMFAQCGSSGDCAPAQWGGNFVI